MTYHIESNCIVCNETGARHWVYLSVYISRKLNELSKDDYNWACERLISISHLDTLRFEKRAEAIIKAATD